MKKLTCTGAVCGEGGEDDQLERHSWKPMPEVQLTDHGPVAWWTCSRCPALTLHDPETEDGFAHTPIVVYPASLFEAAAPACGCPRRVGGQLECLDGCIALEVAIESAALAAERIGPRRAAGALAPAGLCGALCPSWLDSAGRPCGEPHGHDASSYDAHPHRVRGPLGRGSIWREGETPHPDEDTEVGLTSAVLRQAIEEASSRPSEHDLCPVAFGLN